MFCDIVETFCGLVIPKIFFVLFLIVGTGLVITTQAEAYFKREDKRRAEAEKEVIHEET